MTLEEAKAHMKAGGSAHAPYFGWGWQTIYHAKTDAFYDLNPRTGSTLLHTFTARDEVEWKEGPQPEEDSFDD